MSVARACGINIRKKRKKQEIIVLASGDPNLYGITN
jgi:precorrin-6B methylase 1